MQNSEMKRPTGADNPALDWFRHLLPEDGLYPAEDVMIYWNWKDSTVLVRDVAVVYRPLKYIRKMGYEDHPAMMMISAVYNKKQFQCSSGNCYFQDWMKYGNQKSPPPHDPETNANLGFGPDEDFECFKAGGFVSPEEERRAIKEFARIRECQWARDALLGDLISTPLVEDMF